MIASKSVAMPPRLRSGSRTCGDKRKRRCARASLERPDVEVPTSESASGLVVDPSRVIEEQFVAAEQALTRLRNSRMLKLATVGGFFIFLVPIAVLAAIPSLWFEEKLLAVIGGALAALVMAFGLHWLLRRSALKSAEHRAVELAEALARVGEARTTLLRRADSEHARRIAESGSERDRARRRPTRSSIRSRNESLAPKDRNRRGH